MLYYGNGKIKNVYYGSNKIDKIYYGSQLVYQAGSTIVWGNVNMPVSYTGLLYTVNVPFYSPLNDHSAPYIKAQGGGQLVIQTVVNQGNGNYYLILRTPTAGVYPYIIPDNITLGIQNPQGREFTTTLTIPHYADFYLYQYNLQWAAIDFEETVNLVLGYDTNIPENMRSYIKWYLSGGSLPPGLSLNTNTGRITGTNTYQYVGTFNFQIQCKFDAGGGQMTYSNYTNYVINTVNNTISFAVASSTLNSTGTVEYRSRVWGFAAEVKWRDKAGTIVNLDHLRSGYYYISSYVNNVLVDRRITMTRIKGPLTATTISYLQRDYEDFWLPGQLPFYTLTRTGITTGGVSYTTAAAANAVLGKAIRFEIEYRPYSNTSDGSIGPAGGKFNGYTSGSYILDSDKSYLGTLSGWSGRPLRIQATSFSANLNRRFLFSQDYTSLPTNLTTQTNRYSYTGQPTGYNKMFWNDTVGAPNEGYLYWQIGCSSQQVIQGYYNEPYQWCIFDMSPQYMPTGMTAAQIAALPT